MTALHGGAAVDAHDWCVPLTEHGVWARPPAAAAVGCLGERSWLPLPRSRRVTGCHASRCPPRVISSGVLPPAVLAGASVEERGVRPEWYGADCASGPSPLSR
ncbi:MAG: hypothetical protein ACPIOQ_52490 [Promethearchaeia archaeon]